MDKKEQEEQTAPQKPTKQPWEAMRLTDLGDIRTVVKGGGGKLSLVGTDPGESRKTPGGG
jgi:hypothetical protein